MATLKPKVTLRPKQETQVSLSRLIVKLSWTASVDLDLMAFYKAKNGRTGGIFSNNFGIPGSMGNIDKFPFMCLSADSGVGAKGGENQEEMRIANLDEISDLYICTLNYTDAINQVASSFDQYDGYINIQSDAGDDIDVSLDSSLSGHVAVICRIDNNGLAPKLINENIILTLDQFLNKIPGANAIVS